MKNLIRLLSILLLLAGTFPVVTAAATAPAETAAEVTLTGKLQRRMAIGGETTGWVLLYEQGKTIELTFRIELLSRLREGIPFALTGVIETRNYPERGAVRVLVVRLLSEIATSVSWAGGTPRKRTTVSRQCKSGSRPLRSSVKRCTARTSACATKSAD
jgi:hypothetical protein